MNGEHQIVSQAIDTLPCITPTWDSRLARWISNLLNPAILAITSQVLAAVQISTPVAWHWVFYSILISTIMPFMMITYLVKKGKVTDIDIFHRRQRNFPYIFTIACNAIILASMLIGLAPSLLVYLLISSILQGILLFGINLRWKISAHSAGIANFCVFVWFIFGTVALPVMLLIPIMIWSRVRLKRHTLLQTIAGASMGILVLGAFLLYFSTYHPLR